MSFRKSSEVESTASILKDEKESRKLFCCAEGCGCFILKSQGSIQNSFTCDFHKLANKNYWDKVTQRLKQNSWLFKLEKQIVSRRSYRTGKSYPIFFTNEERDEINELVTENKVTELLISDKPKKYGNLERCENSIDYCYRLREFMERLFVPPGYRHGATIFDRVLDSQLDEEPDEFLKVF